MNVQQVPASERFRPNRELLTGKDPEREKGEIEVAVLELVNAIDQADQLLTRLPGRLSAVLSPETPLPPNKPEQLSQTCRSGLGDTLFTQSQRIQDLSSRLSGIMERICL